MLPPAVANFWAQLFGVPSPVLKATIESVNVTFEASSTSTALPSPLEPAALRAIVERVIVVVFAGFDEITMPAPDEAWLPATVESLICRELALSLLLPTE